MSVCKTLMQPEQSDMEVDVAKEAGVNIERKFFLIVKYFILTVTFLCLIAAIGGGVVGSYKFLRRVDTSLKQPKVEYEDLIRAKQEHKNDTGQGKPEEIPPGEKQQPPSRKSDEIPLEYLEILTRIEILLKSFALKADQQEPTNNTRLMIYKKAATLGKHIPVVETLKLLEAECKKLESDAARIKLLLPDDMERILWTEFLDFFSRHLRLISQGK